MICEKKNLMLAFFGRVAGMIIAQFQYFYLHYQIYTTKHTKIAQYQMKFQKFTVFLSYFSGALIHTTFRLVRHYMSSLYDTTC